jgi:hypothetical protein
MRARVANHYPTHPFRTVSEGVFSEVPSSGEEACVWGDVLSFASDCSDFTNSMPHSTATINGTIGSRNNFSFSRANDDTSGPIASHNHFGVRS